MRTKLTLLNALFSVINMVISSILSLLMTRTVLKFLGSDYNGLNSTISQFLSVLMLCESGFTLAALVKLYKPYDSKDYAEVNRILSKSRKSLTRIGIIMLLIGLCLSAIYAFFIQSNVEYAVIFGMFFFSVAATAFNFAYTYKYRLVYQVTQHEYILHIISIGQYTVMYLGMMFLVRQTKNILYARGFYMIMDVAGGLVIGYVARRKFNFIQFDVECSNVRVEGTKDLFVSKLVGVLYSSLTVFYMSVFSGTVLTSVYAVYNSVVSIINNFVNTALMAPQNSLGQLINSDRERAGSIVKEYEYTAVLMSAVLFSTTMALIVPFIRIYTASINDVNYIQPAIAVVLILTAVLQIIHIPSGRCIEMSGDFGTVKKIQLITFLLLATFSVIGGWQMGFMGLLIAKLLTNVVLASMEIYYAHTNILDTGVSEYLKVLIPHAVLACLISTGEYYLLSQKTLSLPSFFAVAIAIVLLNSLIMFMLGMLCYRNLMNMLLTRYSKLLPFTFARRKQ